MLRRVVQRVRGITSSGRGPRTEERLSHRPTDPLDKKTAAKLAELAYETSHDRRREVADRLGYTYDKGFSTDEAQVYLHRAGGRPVIAFRGTVPTRLDDLRADADVLKGSYDHRRFREGREKARAVRGAYGQVPVLVGHSLGGTIADHVARNEGMDAVVFNPGVSPVNNGGYGLTTTVYRNTKDAVSAGKVDLTRVPQDLGDLMQLMDAHSVAQFSS